MSTNFIQKGELINYTANTKDITSGELVIIGSIAGVAKTHIPIGSMGAIHITGVYSIPKASEAILQGSKVYWSSKDNQVTIKGEDNISIGVAFNNTTSSDPKAEVLLNIGI